MRIIKLKNDSKRHEDFIIDITSDEEFDKLPQVMRELIKTDQDNMHLKSGARINGRFDVVVRDKDGNIKQTTEAENLVVNQGLNNMLDITFHGTSQTNPWYVGLKDTGTIAAADTLASHAGWAEFTSYTGNRKEYQEAAAVNQSITNTANVAIFNADATDSAYGAFLCSAATGTSGELFCAADFANVVNVESGDEVEITYTISVADDGV